MIPLYTPPSNTPMKWRSLVHLITPNASRRSSVELLALDAAGGSFSGKRRRRRPSAPAVLEDLRRILAPARMLRRYHSSSMLVNEDSTESGGTISNAQHSNTRRKYSNPQSRALNHSDLHYVANVFSYCNSSSAAPASTQVQQGRRSAPTSPSSILFCHGRDLQLGLESGGATTVAQFGSSQAQQVQIGRNEPLSGGARFKCKRVKAARKSSAAPTSTLSSDEIRVGGESQPESLAQSTAGQSLSAAETQLQSQGHRRFAQLFKRKPAPVSSTVSKHRQERIRSISTAGLFRCSLSTSSGSAGSSVEPLLVGLESNLADGIILRSFGTVPQDAVRPVILHSFAKDLQSVIDKSNENCGNSNERIQQIQSQKEQKESETAYSDRVERHNVGTITVHAETRNYQTQTETDYSDFNGYSVRPDTLRLVASTQTQDEETQKDTIEEADTVARTTIAERADIESNLVDVSQRQRFKTPLSSTQEEEEKFCREKRASAAPSDSITCGCVQFLQNNNNIHNKNASFRRRNSDYSDSRRESVQKSSTRLSSLRGLKSKSGTSSGGVKLSPRLFLRGAKSSPAASPASSSSASERAATVAETVAGDTNANLYVRRHTVPNMTVAAYGMVICGTDNIHRRYRGRIEKVKFGIPISEAFVHDIPATLLVLLLKVNKEGPLKKDIWRAPGNQIQVRKLSAIMQQGRLVNISNISVYTAASVLKKFLSKLPGGIFGAENEKLLFGIAQQTNEEEQRKIFCRVVCGLSQPSQHLLVLLFGTFRVISDSADAFGTRMNADAIGISVAPSLFHTCIHDQRAKLEDVMRFKMASQVITRIIHGFGCTNLFPRECYEFYARITGRTLRVDDQWNFVFQYPSNANGTTTTSPVGDATPGVVALPAVVLRKSSSRASATTSGAVRARRSANRKSSTSSTTIPSMISSLQATCAVAAATAAAADVDDAKNRDLRTESEEEKIDDQQQSTVSLLTDVLRNENTHFKSTSFASLNNYNNFGSDGTNSYGGDASDIANTARYEYELRKSYKTQMLSKSGPETGLVFGADENSAPNDCANALKTSRTSINTRARENLGAVRAPMTSALSIGCLPNFTSKTAADFQRLRFCAQKQSQPHQQEDTISKDVQRAQSFKYETVVESSNNKLQDRDLHSYKGGTSIGTTNSSRFDFSESVKSYRDYDNAESRPTEPPIEVMTTNSSIAKAVNLRAKSPRNLQSMESHFRGTFTSLHSTNGGGLNVDESSKSTKLSSTSLTNIKKPLMKEYKQDGDCEHRNNEYGKFASDNAFSRLDLKHRDKKPEILLRRETDRTLDSYKVSEARDRRAEASRLWQKQSSTHSLHYTNANLPSTSASTNIGSNTIGPIMAPSFTGGFRRFEAPSSLLCANESKTIGRLDDGSESESATNYFAEFDGIASKLGHGVRSIPSNSTTNLSITSISSGSHCVNRYGFDSVTAVGRANRVAATATHYPTESLQRRINAYCSAANISKPIGAAHLKPLKLSKFHDNDKSQLQ